MFQTYDINKLNSPFCNDREHVWDLVSFILDQPWFHVTFLVTGDHAEEFERSVMLKELHQIIELSQRNDLKLRFVDVVSPGFVNGSGRWKMEPLKEVWLCKQEDDLNEYRYDHVFILESGEKYCCLATPPEDKNCKNVLIFSRPKAESLMAVNNNR